MPLLKGKSRKVISANIDTLMGEVGKSPHVQSRKQAIAIAMAQSRRGKNHGYHDLATMTKMMKQIHGYSKSPMMGVK